MNYWVLKTNACGQEQIDNNDLVESHNYILNEQQIDFRSIATYIALK